MRVKLGCQPLTWGNNVAKAAREIGEIGFDGIEAPVGNYLEHLSELKALLAENNLVCSSTYTGGAFEDPEKREELTENIVRIAAALPLLDCRQIILSAGPRPKNEDDLSSELYERFADGVNECARRCYEEYGIVSVFHNHAWTLIESPQEVDTFMELTDPVYVKAGFDTAQLAYGGYEPVEAFRKWRDRIGYVHLKDNHPQLPTSLPIAEKNALRNKKSSKKFHVFAPLGEGALGDAPIVAVLDFLREINYQGWIISELDSCDGSPREGNQKNYEWLTKHIKADERG